MKVRLFDHIKHGDRPTAQMFDERLAFIQAADAAGFYCLHLAKPLRLFNQMLIQIAEWGDSYGSRRQAHTCIAIRLASLCHR